MLIVDSHCHASPHWYEPMETLLFQMDRTGVAQAVLVQLLGQFDNGYQQACVQRHPDRLASVVGVDTAAPGACDTLRRWADAGARGVRLRPGARSPGGDPLALWRTAHSLGLAVSCVGQPAAFCDPAFAALVAELPGLPIVLEHLGGTSTPDADEASRTARCQVHALARYANVYLKLPGLGELCPRAANWSTEGHPFDTGMPATLASALQHFGPERLMWGSDFPPVAAREGYATALHGCLEVLAPLAPAQQAQIFGGTAQRVFGLRPDQATA